MKSVITLMNAALMLTTCSWSQTLLPVVPSRFELSVGYSRWATFGFSGGDYNPSYGTYTGAFSLAARDYLSRKFTVGCDVAWENETGVWNPLYYDPPVQGAPPSMGTFKRMAFTAAPELTYTYSQTPKGRQRFYATVAVGLTFLNELDTYSPAYEFQYVNGVNQLGNEMDVQNNKLHANGYVSPIGMRFGRALSAFFELGYGYKGILNGGLTDRIK